MKIGLILKALALGSVMLASGNLNAAQNSQSESSDENVEKVEIVGKKSSGLRRKELYKFEDEFFDSYNDLVGKNELKIDCGYHKRTWSNVKVRACIPRYVGIAVSNELTDSASAMRGGLQASSMLSGVPDVAMIKKNKAKLEKEASKRMAELINENPKLAEKYLAYLNAKEKFNSSLEETE